MDPEPLDLLCPDFPADVPACDPDSPGSVLTCPEVLEYLRHFVISGAELIPDGPLSEHEDDFDVFILSAAQFVAAPTSENCTELLNNLNVDPNRCSATDNALVTAVVISKVDNRRIASCTFQANFEGKGAPEFDPPIEPVITICSETIPKPTAKDGCGGNNVSVTSVVGKNILPCCQSFTIEWTATDTICEELSTTKEQTVNVLTGPPQITCPADQCNLKAGTDICDLDITGRPTAVNGCGDEIIEGVNGYFKFSDKTVCTSCCTGEICVERTWTAFDQCDNEYENPNPKCTNNPTCVQKICTVNRRYQRFFGRQGCGGCSNGGCSTGGGSTGGCTLCQTGKWAK